MTWPFESTAISAGFDQPRPLAAPTHPHGAIDVPMKVGSLIKAPERGMLHYWVAFRPDTSRTFAELGHVEFPFLFLGRPYFYDVYGGVVILLGESGMTHVMTHSYVNQLFNNGMHALRWRYAESQKDERFPVTAWYTTNGAGHYVGEGAVIAASGNAGYSTGPHVHYEIHRGARWEPHADRPRPEEIHEFRGVDR